MPPRAWVANWRSETLDVVTESLMLAGGPADENTVVKRRVISVIQSRMEDVAVGDVVNRNPDAQKGWFRVVEISTLFNGELQLSDETELVTIAATNMDIVGVQVFDEVEIDANGLLVAAAPAPVMIAPAAAAAPIAAAAPAAPVSGQPSAPAAAESSAEAKPLTIGSQIMRDVDQLTTVANLLDSLDFESAPEIEVRTEPLPGAKAAAPAPAPPPERAPKPAIPEPVMPDGAVPVFGDTLPDKPSYKNPVVVAQGDKPLPKRRQAA